MTVEQATEEALLSAQNEFWTAMKNKDRQAFEQVLAEDFVFRSPGQPDQDRQDFIDTLTAFPANILSIGSYDLEVHLFGEVGLISGVQTAEIELPAGPQLANSIAITNVFRGQGDRWVMKLSHAVEVQPEAGTASLADEAAVSALYWQLLDSWNRRSAEDFAALFDEQAVVVGFDGSQMNGPEEVGLELSRIFADHVTAAYVGKIRSVRFLSPMIAILRAVAGLVPPGQKDLNPAANSIQTLAAARQAGQWRIVLFQNTPAQFHDRPELAEALTEELRQLL